MSISFGEVTNGYKLGLVVLGIVLLVPSVMSARGAASFTSDSPVDPGQDFGLEEDVQSFFGEPTTIKWDLDDDGNYEANGNFPGVSRSSKGEYTIGAKIETDQGNTFNDGGVVQVGTPPSASLTDNGPVGVGEEVTLDASGSSDPDGSVEKYYFDVDGDGNIEKPTSGIFATWPTSTKFSYSTAGSKTAVVYILDNDGLQSSDSTTFTVEDNDPPNASLSITPSKPLIGESVDLDASGSSDPDGDSLTYSWSGDVSGTGSSISASFNSPGTKSVTVTVSDGNGGSDSVTESITVDAFEGGDGSSGNPYEISTCASLQYMQNDLGGSYVLVGDIDCSGFSYSSVDDAENKFTGVLDGQSYQVENLEINEGSSWSVGLIGSLGEGGEVKDIGVVNVDINGSDEVGGLLGENYQGSVSNSFVEGSVSGVNAVAGLVGRNNGGSISNSYSNGTVSGSDLFSGGLVGENFRTTASISQSFSAADVSGDYLAGGLVGGNEGSISESYSIGSVSGNEFVGGLIGGSSESVSGSYWDVESSGQSSSDGGTGLTTSEMQGSACGMSGFSESNWNFFSGEYPKSSVFSSGGLTRSCNTPPDQPSTPSPTGDPISLNPTLSATVSDPDGDNLDVTFKVDKNNDGTHGTTLSDNNVASGDPASVSLSSLATSQTVDWYVEISDGSETTTSSEFSFTTVGKPSITSGTASPTGIEVSKSADLQVDVTHPDNLDMNVQFTMNGSNVGSDTVTGGSGTASVNPSLGYSEDHSWSVDVDTQGYSTSSSGGSWSFETVDNTSLNSISGPENDPAPLNPELEASVSHSDPSEQLTVEFVNDDNGNVICSQSGVTDTETVNCDPSGEAFAGSTGTSYNWRVDLSGDRASESDSSSVQSFTTVSAPTVSLNSPNDGEENVATDSDLVANVNQAEGLELNTVITLEDDQGNFVDDYSVNSNSGQINFSDPNLELSENYQWYADTSIIDSTYSQGDTSGTRTFSTEHDFRVNGVYPSDGREAFGVNDSIDVEFFHSSDRSIDVQFYFNDTASGTPDVTKTVTSSGSAVNATVDTENFASFGEETGTKYNWSYVVSDGASDTGDITDEGLNYTTVHRPELSLSSPTDGGTNIDINGGLDISVQQDDNISTSITAQLDNEAGSESGVTTDTVIGTAGGTTASFPLSSFDFVKAGETYSYNATGQINNPGDVATIEDSTGLNSFTISEKPEVTSVEPVDDKKGAESNPLLNVSVDHAGNDQITVEFYNWEKTGSEAFIREKTVAAGDTASADISDSEIGDSPQVYYWYVNVTTESGTSWDNRDNPYRFTVASTGSVNYEANTESDVNLNPDNAADQGLDKIIGREKIMYQVSNGVGAEMPGIGFNVSNGTHSEVFGEVNDVESGSSVTVDLGDSSLIEEDKEGYEIYAFYQETGTDFTGEDYRSDTIQFSTHVAEVEWVNPGQPSSQPINEYRLYHSNRSGEAFSEFDFLGSISDDDSGSFNIGVANLELGESSSDECFRIVSWNVAGESDPTSEQCVGVVP